MGKSIVIKGADFSQNALPKEVILPKVTMEKMDQFVGRTDGLFRAWGPYIENESLAVGAKLLLPSASEAVVSNYELYVVEVGTTYSEGEIPGTLIATGSFPEERSEQVIYFNNPVHVGGNTQIVIRTPVLFGAPASDPTYIEDGWQYYTNCSREGVVAKDSNPAPNLNVYYRFGISLIIEV